MEVTVPKAEVEAKVSKRHNLNATHFSLVTCHLDYKGNNTCGQMQLESPTINHRWMLYFISD